jgi:hypothetical protein
MQELLRDPQDCFSKIETALQQIELAASRLKAEPPVLRVERGLDEAPLVPDAATMGASPDIAFQRIERAVSRLKGEAALLRVERALSDAPLVTNDAPMGASRTRAAVGPQEDQRNNVSLDIALQRIERAAGHLKAEAALLRVERAIGVAPLVPDPAPMDALRSRAAIGRQEDQRNNVSPEIMLRQIERAVSHLKAEAALLRVENASDVAPLMPERAPMDALRAVA